MSPAEVIIFYKGILRELLDVPIGKKTPQTAHYAQPDALVTQRWIDATQRRLEQLKGRIPKMSPGALRAKKYRERRISKNGQPLNIKEKINGLSKIKRSGSNRKS